MFPIDLDPDLFDLSQCPQAQVDAAAFSARCLSCHQPKQCGEYAKIGDQIVRNCIDCHMPLQESRVLFSNTNRKRLAPKVRNHQIAIYAGESVH